MRREVLESPLSGIISQIDKSSGSFVKVDELILSIECMKLLHPVTAGLSGKLNLSIQIGQFVQESEILGEIIED